MEALVCQLYGKKWQSVDDLHYEIHCARGSAAMRVISTTSGYMSKVSSSNLEKSHCSSSINPLPLAHGHSWEVGNVSNVVSWNLCGLDPNLLQKRSWNYSLVRAREHAQSCN